MVYEQQLTVTLNREIDSLQALLDILKQEYKALINADIEAIEQVTISKNQALTTQAEIVQARQELTVQSSFSGTTDGLLQLVASCENHEELSFTFSRLSTLSEECQTANRANGRLIAQKQRQARGALDIIRRTDHNTPTYSDMGKTMTAQDTRSLGKA